MRPVPRPFPVRIGEANGDGFWFGPQSSAGGLQWYLTSPGLKAGESVRATEHDLELEADLVLPAPSRIDLVVDARTAARLAGRVRS